MNDEPNRIGTRWIASASESHSSAAFRAHLQHFDLSILDVALAARVRLSSIWCIERGIPVREDHAQAVRAGLYRLTGVSYTDRIAVIPAEIMQVIQEAQRAR